MKANTGLALPPAGLEKGYFVHFGTHRICSNPWHHLFNSSRKELMDHLDMHCQVSHNLLGLEQGCKKTPIYLEKWQKWCGNVQKWMDFIHEECVEVSRVVTGCRPGWFCPEKGRYVLVYHFFFLSVLFLSRWISARTRCAFHRETNPKFNKEHLNPIIRDFQGWNPLGRTPTCFRAALITAAPNAVGDDGRGGRLEPGLSRAGV